MDKDVSGTGRCMMCMGDMNIERGDNMTGKEIVNLIRKLKEKNMSGPRPRIVTR